MRQFPSGLSRLKTRGCGSRYDFICPSSTGRGFGIRHGGAVSETDLQRSIISALAAIGVEAIRQQCGLARGAKGGRMQMAPNGTPDLQLVMFRTSYLEVKTAKGKLSLVQLNRHAELEQAGARVAVVRSVTDAFWIVKKWQGDDAYLKRLVEAERAIAAVGLGDAPPSRRRDPAGHGVRDRQRVRRMP